VLSIGAPVLYLGSTVVHWPSRTAYAEARRADEADLAASGLPWAVLRPCAPYGPPLAHHRARHRESFHRLAALAATLPLVPVPGDGRARRQPIHVDDLAELALRLLEGGLPGEAFDAGGSTAHTFDELVRILARAHGRRARPLHVPTALLAQVARFSADFDPELMRAADADDVADPGPVAARTGFLPRGFEAGAADLVAGLRRYG
jgi:NADH dehydrogenase